jgi:acyl dehydratase
MSSVSEVWPRGVPRIGQKASRSRRVERNDIERFTEISGDRNPLHYDEALAQASKFGEIIVQGGVTSAILNAVVAEDLPGPGTVFLQVNWSFKAPVRPGDVITGSVEVVDVREDKPITKLKTAVSRQDGVVALEGDAVCYTMPLKLG